MALLPLTEMYEILPSFLKILWRVYICTQKFLTTLTLVDFHFLHQILRKWIEMNLSESGLCDEIQSDFGDKCLKLLIWGLRIFAQREKKRDRQPPRPQLVSLPEFEVCRGRHNFNQGG